MLNLKTVSLNDFLVGLIKIKLFPFSSTLVAGESHLHLKQLLTFFGVAFEQLLEKLRATCWEISSNLLKALPEEACVLWGREWKVPRAVGVCRMELSFVITQGVILHGVKPYITTLQAAA